MTKQMQQYMEPQAIVKAKTVQASQPLKNSFKIARAKSPVIIISEKSADSWGRMSKYLADTIPNAPVVFETEKAKKDFMNVAGVERRYFEHVTLGVVAIDANPRGATAAQFNESDCVIVLGTVDKAVGQELGQLKNDLRHVFIMETASASGVTRQPSKNAFNFAMISKITERRNIHRDSSWLNLTRSIRPNCWG